MTPIERDWLLEQAAAGLLTDADQPRLQALLTQDASAQKELTRSRRLNAVLTNLPAAPDHDTSLLVRQVMANVPAEQAWQITPEPAVISAKTGESGWETMLPAVPVHESAVFQAVIREKLSSPQDRVEYLACGLAGGFLDRDEAGAAAHRLAGDPTARSAFAGHEKLDHLLALWSAQADAAVAAADLSRLHEALEAEINPAPATIPFVQPTVEPALQPVQSRAAKRPHFGSGRFGWFLGGLAAAAAVGLIWLGIRLPISNFTPASVTGPGASLVKAEVSPAAGQSTLLPRELELAFAGPSLAPEPLDKDAVLLVAFAPAVTEPMKAQPSDAGLLPADDADARPRGTVTVAVDTAPRAASAEEAMVYF